MNKIYSINSLKENIHLPKFDYGVSLLCWAYNEEELIEDFLTRAIKLLDDCVSDYEIVVVDDCSNDKTYQILQKWSKQYPQIKVYKNLRNLNVGLSFQRAIQCATKEYLFWQTIDWSYDISRLKTFLHMLSACDVVAGVRSSPVQGVDKNHPLLISIFKMFNKNHITKRSDTLYQAVISVINYMVIRLLFRVPVSDYQNICFYRTKAIQSIVFESRSSFSNPEHLIKSYWQGAYIVEVPISFLPRQKGESKGVKPKALLNSIRDIVRLWFKWILLGGRGVVKCGTVDTLKVSSWTDL